MLEKVWKGYFSLGICHISWSQQWCSKVDMKPQNQICNVHSFSTRFPVLIPTTLQMNLETCPNNSEPSFVAQVRLEIYYLHQVHMQYTLFNYIPVMAWGGNTTPIEPDYLVNTTWCILSVWAPLKNKQASFIPGILALSTAELTTQTLPHKYMAKSWRWAQVSF